MQVYEKAVEFVVTSGEAACIELLAPPRGELKKFVIKQLDGTTDGYTADLFNREDACSSVVSISGDYDPQNLMDPELHRVIDQVTVASGSRLSAQYSLEAGYQNLDEQDIRRTPNSRLYLEVSAAGAGEKRFQVAYAIEPFEL